VERIRSALRASAWKGLGHPLPGGAGKKRKRADGGEGDVGRRYTLEQLRSVVQASEAELDKALKERNVVEIDGESAIRMRSGAC
jgi:sister chromatid cohesion protein DCC1